ncbi:MAG: 16S rRNA methyltransferase [Ignavibacteria bacterium]
MEFFYSPPTFILAHSLTIEGEEFAHLTHVMRKKVGDEICVVDGVGHAYDVRIEELTKRTARCRILQRHDRLHEQLRDVVIAAAVLKNSSRFDILVEKCTELGVNAIVPLQTERTLPSHAKTTRWQKIALAAMKQSERCVLPTIHDLHSFHDFLASIPDSSLKLLPHEKVAGPMMSEVIRDASSIVVCIGPEGGFSDEEVSAARAAGFQSVSLGPRRLRTETAAIVAAAICSR